MEKINPKKFKNEDFYGFENWNTIALLVLKVPRSKKK
jgi:hypothetical protein